LTYSGSAEVQNSNPSQAYDYASGGGNVYLTNTPGTYFQISGFKKEAFFNAVSITFGLNGYDPNNPVDANEMRLSYSLDSGVTWSPLFYGRMYALYNPNTTWMAFTATIATSVNPFVAIDQSKLFIRFTQNTTTKSFRLDDIIVSYVGLLPTKLTYFNGTVKSRQAFLNWRAESSNNKESFVVEKSYNGVNFSSLNTEQAKGKGEFDYSYVDDYSGTKTFYRLRMINADGRSRYSAIVLLNDSPGGKNLIQSVYPVPAKEFVRVQMNSVRDQVIKLSIVDNEGRIRLTKDVLLNDGINNCQLDVKSLRPGTYYLTAGTSAGVQAERTIAVGQ
jgi:hypothetical protein